MLYLERRAACRQRYPIKLYLRMVHSTLFSKFFSFLSIFVFYFCQLCFLPHPSNGLTLFTDWNWMAFSDISFRWCIYVYLISRLYFDYKKQVLVTSQPAYHSYSNKNKTSKSRNVTLWGLSLSLSLWLPDSSPSPTHNTYIHAYDFV